MIKFLNNQRGMYRMKLFTLLKIDKSSHWEPLRRQDDCFQALYGAIILLFMSYFITDFPFRCYFKWAL